MQETAIVETVDRFRPSPVGTSDHVDFMEYLTHPTKIAHISWTVTTAYTVITKDLNGLWFTSQTTLFRNKIANLFYYKGIFRIKVVVQGNPIAAGKVALVFTPRPFAPMIGTTTHVVAGAQYQNYRVLPHLSLDPSKTATYELDLPVCTPNGWYSNAGGAGHGSYEMELMVINAMTSGTAVAPTANICVYASLVNPAFQGLTQTLSGAFVKEKKADGLLSTAAKGAAKLAQAGAAIFPNIAPHLTLFSTVSGVVGDVLSFFGFSKPPVLENTHMVLNRTCDNYSQCDGRTTALVLGGSQAQSLALNPGWGLGDLQDMDIAKICSLPGAVALDLSIPLATAGEATLFAFPVDPGLQMGTTSQYWYTPVGGIANMFDYWVGDLDFEFEFVSSVFHRGTVLIAWDPASNTQTFPAFVDALSTLKNVTVDVSGNTSVKIRIPYKQPMPWVAVGGPLTRVNSTTFGQGNGMIYMYLVNPITNNGSTDGIHFNVYVSSSNIRFAQPDCQTIQARSVVTEVLSNEFVPEQIVEFGPVTDLSDAPFRAFGDCPQSIKQIASRMMGSVNDSSAALVAGNEFRSINVANLPLWIPSVHPVTTQPTYTSYVGYLSTAFLGYRGGLRFSHDSYFNANTSTVTAKTYIGHSNFFGANAPVNASQSAISGFKGLPSLLYAWTQPNLLVSSRADYIAPMMIPVDFAPSRNVYSNYSDSIVIYQTPSVPATGLILNTIVTQGAADDATFTWFLGFPRMG